MSNFIASFKVFAAVRTRCQFFWDLTLRQWIYKSKWLRHVTRLNNNRLPKVMLNYRMDEDDLENL